VATAIGGPTDEAQATQVQARRALTIRSHLLLLAIAAALPVLAFALIACLLLIDHDGETRKAGAMDRARAMMTAVDAELRGSIAALQALAASRALASDDLAGFQVSAARVLETQRTWLDVAVAASSGARLMNVKSGTGSGVPAPDPASIERVVRTGEPAVGDVVLDSAGGAPGVPVRVPVLRAGALAYVLTAIVRADSFADLIMQQHLPAQWVSGIVDRQRRFVARIPAVPAGTLSSENFRAAVAAANEGWYRGRTVEGMDTFTAHKTSDFSGWSIGLAIPRGTVQGAARRSAWFMAIGTLISIGAALAVTSLVGGRISEPIRSLAAGARSLGRGGELRFADDGGVREVSEVAVALRDAAAAVRERQRLLEREKEALKAADTAKDEFLAMLSHELRNPLAAMNTAAHVLKVYDPADAAAGRARAVMERQTRHMTRLIEDLLDVSRIAMGKAKLEKAPLDLAEAVSNVVEAARGAGRLSAHRFESVASPAWIEGDRARVEQIASNLLDNAVKFTPPGKKIAIAVEREDGIALLRVSDEGEGVAPELLGRVFELFVQGERGLDRSKGGMGIGLALVKRLTEMHGGTVAAESGGPGRGATFTVRFPAVQPAQVRVSAPAARAAGATRRILIIEDNDDAREMLRESLLMSGHQVSVARDGASGLAIAASALPEVALVDVGLPDMDGYQVARHLRSSANARMFLVALTGYGQPDDRRRALEAGFDLHLTKPVETDRLETILVTLGREAKGRAGTGESA
jgi:signal transduction histidine kinase/ActR/RegA family two-component response regulator